MKDKIEVEMLSPLMAEFIPDYSDIVDLDDAEPLEGPDLVQYQTSIAEKVDEINRLGMPDNQPCNLIDYFDQNISHDLHLPFQKAHLPSFKQLRPVSYSHP